MKYCPECDQLMDKFAIATGIIFRCDCGMTTVGGEDDTLMEEEYFDGTNNGNLIHEAFVENAPHDPAANIVTRDCRCGLNFMTLIRVGDETIYTCSCGYVIKHVDYMKQTKKASK